MNSTIRRIRGIPASLAAALALSSGFIISHTAQAATLEERAVYTVKILPAGDPAESGQCSAFTFGDVRTVCPSAPSAFQDNAVAGAPALSGGDGIAGDGLAGSLTVETSKADGSGNMTFSISAFQMDPYLATAGGVFKTTMTPPDGSLVGSGGTVTAAGQMTLDATGRTGVAQFFEGSIGIQPWNVDDSAAVAGQGVAVTNQWELFTTGSSTNYNPGTGAANLTLTGRPIGDANSDSILDAVLVSVGNVGSAWGAFDGTPYSEAFNVQFELVSSQPVANPDTLGAVVDTPLIINQTTDLLANDTDADGGTLTISTFDAATTPGGSVADNGNGTLTYTPPASFTGNDTFTYTISDGVSTDTATVTINVSASTNTPPVATDLNAATDEDSQLVIDPTSNDTDTDGDTLTITAFDNPSAQGGSVVDNGDNTLTYTPAANFNGTDSVSYTISDGRGGTASATVLITVNPVNDSLVCTDVSLSTGLATPLDIDVAAALLSTCTDVEGDTITLDSTTQPTQTGSSLSFDGTSTLTYTPAASLIGQDTFTYTATDGTATDTRTVTISVGKIYGNFTMLQVECKTFGGTNDIVADWDGTLNTSVTDTNFNMTMGSDTTWPFFGFVWTAHHIRVFGPGSYSFDSSCSTAQVEAGLADCGGAPGEFLNLTISAGQTGAHMLFDWNKTKNIDVVLHWDANGQFAGPPLGELYQGPASPAGAPPIDAVFELVSRDVEGDGCPGARMIDGDFVGYRANFNLNFTTSTAGGGTVTAPPSSISDPDLGSVGCTIGGSATSGSGRGDLLILAGFIAWLGAGTLRRRHRTQTE